jgi:exosortase
MRATRYFESDTLPANAAGSSLPSAPRVLLIGLLFVLLYGQIVAGLARDWWQEPSLSYGMLLPPMAFYFAWMERAQLIALPAHPTRNGLWLVGLSSLLFVFGKLSATEYFYRLSLVVCLAGLIWTAWGSAGLTVLARPLVLLGAMVPPPALIMDRLSLPLRLLASDWSTVIAQGMGVTVNRDGNIINLANISLGVEDACSGLNSLLAMMVTALLLSFISCPAVWGRFLLVAFAIPLAVFFNILRIAGTAVIADYQPDVAMGFYHMFSGWAVFVAGALSLWTVAKAVERWA